MPSEKREPLRLEDSNMALVNSDIAHKVREANARQEPAWHGCGQKSGETRVWRIEKFKVVAWPEEQYGTFYDGDSYIVLHTTAKKSAAADTASDALQWDIYFWLGRYTTIDEAGTAAIKTIELDDFLGGEPVQHRELQGCESAAFLQLFEARGGVKILNGGIESGFRTVDRNADRREPRLFHVAGPTMRSVRVSQLPTVSASLMSEGDAYVLDDGSKHIYVFRGRTASPGEAAKAAMFASSLESELKGMKMIPTDSESAHDEFWSVLGGRPDKELPAEFDDTLVKHAVAEEQKQHQQDVRLPEVALHKVTGPGSLELFASGDDAVRHAAVESGDCYVLVAPTGVSQAGIVCWVGLNASGESRRSALGCAYDLLKKLHLSPGTPISKVTQGRDQGLWSSFVHATSEGSPR